jgi:hypothetical protein
VQTVGALETEPFAQLAGLFGLVILDEAHHAPAEGPAVPVLSILVVDLRERRVTYRGRQIRTKPPHNLQRQPLLALAVLAGAPGKTLTMADLAEGMHRLGGLQKRPVAPDARDLRYKILRPFRRAFADAPDLRPDIDRLVESVPGVGLRLSAKATDILVTGIEHGVPLRTTEHVRAMPATDDGQVAVVAGRGR